MNWPKWDAEKAIEIINSLKSRPGAALPVLHGLNDYFGYVDTTIIPTIADALNLSRAEIHGVLSFYHDFKITPPTGLVVKLCRAEACQAMGSEDLVAHLAAAHGMVPDQIDHVPGTVAVQSIYCLGNCALGPSALVDGVPVGRLSKSRLDALISHKDQA